MYHSRWCLVVIVRSKIYQKNFQKQELSEKRTCFFSFPDVIRSSLSQQIVCLFAIEMHVEELLIQWWNHPRNLGKRRLDEVEETVKWYPPEGECIRVPKLQAIIGINEVGWEILSTRPWWVPVWSNHCCLWWCGVTIGISRGDWNDINIIVDISVKGSLVVWRLKLVHWWGQLSE